MTPTTEQKILDKLDGVERKTNEIHLFVAGNPKYGQKGLKDVIDDHTEEIKDIKDWMGKKDKAAFKTNAIVGTVSATGGFLGGIATKTGIAKFLAFIGALKNIF